MIDEAQGSGAGEIPDTRACESHEASASPARATPKPTTLRRALPTAPATLDSWQTIHAARAALERATRAA